MIDLSIIIVSRNQARYFPDCLTSLHQSIHKIKFEVILVDNGSADNSIKSVREKFPDVKIIENKGNLGFSRANNQGLKVYQGRYALLLNADTITRDGAFDKMVEFMDTHPDAGACGPKLLNPNGTPQHQGGLFNKRFWLSQKPVRVDYVIGAALMARREVIEKVGRLDENLFFSNDDLDWCRRIRKAGWSVYFVPHAEIVHYGGYTIKKFNADLFIEGFRGGLYFCRKHYGFIIYQIYRLLLIVAMALATLFSLLIYPLLKNREKPGVFWRIMWIAIKGEIIPRYGKPRKILLVSNGHAEDLAAAAIGAGLREKMPEAEIKGMALVGLGKAYDKKGIENLGLRETLPSGGFAKEGSRHFWEDLKAGLIGQLFRQIRILRQEGKTADLVVAVGDLYLVALCGLFIKKPLIFIDGPKSVKIEGYYPIEKWLMKKFCKQILNQDQETADYLKKEGLPAQFLGSWVMDYVEATGEDFGVSQDQAVIGMLPGTREEAYDNLILILEVFEKLSHRAKAIGLIASALERGRLRDFLKSRGWIFNELSGEKGLTAKIVSGSGATAFIAEGKFGDVCLRSKLIIGLAGIANEQAVAFGKPAVCFEGKGAQTTLRRWKEIQKITGRSMTILDGSAEEKAQKILEILNDPRRMEEMARIGKASKPVWGGVEKIAQLILKFVS
jgi:hypothetical protein